MDRRGVLRLLALSSLGLAGCNSDSNGGRFRKEPTTDGRERAAETLSEPARDVLRVVAGVSLVDDAWTVRVSAGNTAGAPATAEFTGVVSLADDGGRIESDPVEQTVPPGETTSFDIPLAAPGDLSYTEETTLRYDGFELRLLVDGEPKSGVCPDAETVVPTGNGCAYRNPNRTYVTVEYDGDWEGSVNADAFSTSVSRAEDGAPPGYDTSYIDVGDDAETVAASIFKTDDGDGELVVNVHNDGIVVASDSTTDPDEIVQVTATL
jgi:hypothetical protein